MDRRGRGWLIMRREDEAWALERDCRSRNVREARREPTKQEPGTRIWVGVVAAWAADCPVWRLSTNGTRGRM